MIANKEGNQISSCIILNPKEDPNRTTTGVDLNWNISIITSNVCSKHLNLKEYVVYLNKTTRPNCPLLNNNFKKPFIYEYTKMKNIQILYQLKKPKVAILILSYILQQRILPVTKRVI